MVNRLYRTFAFGAAELFFLLMVLSCQAGMAGAEMEQPPAVSQPAQLAGNRKITPRKTHSKKIAVIQSKQIGKQPDSAFVTLSRLMTGARQPLASHPGAAVSGFDPDNVAFILGADTAKWAIGFRSDYFAVLDDQDLAFLKTNITMGKLAYQSLSGSRIYQRPGNSSKAVSPYPLSMTLAGISIPSEIDGLEGKEMLGMYSSLMDLQGGEFVEITKRSGSPFAYRYQKNKVSVNAGFAWINDIADSSGSSKAFEETSFNSTSDKLSGLNFNLGAKYRALALSGGYIRALDKFAPVHLSLDDSESRSSVWNSELAYTTELLDKETVLAVGYQRSSEALQVYLPEQRYITKASMALFEGTTLILEYYLDKENIEKRSGSDDQGYGFTTRIGFGL